MSDGRVLAIDYGRRWIGLAISDPLGLTAQGLPTLEVHAPSEAIKAIREVVFHYEVGEIVVGLPLHLSGNPSRQSQQSRRFAAELEKACQRPVRLWDERFSSAEAARAMHEMGKSPSRHRSKLNELAAVFILRGYLDRQRIQRER